MQLTTVVYHYVRDLAGSRYPDIKGLDLTLFSGQLDYLQRHYNPISASDLIAAIQADDLGALPERPVLLTFDDGLSDHYRSVFPMLRERGMSGAFFAPAGPVRERRVLDVHKIHFILATVDDKVDLYQRLIRLIDEASGEFDLQDIDHYRARWMKPTLHGDPLEVVFIKKMLQRGLPPALRQRFIDDLFAACVSADEADFADELYASVDELREMHDGGMYIGGHGVSHRWLDSLEPEQLNEEMDGMVNFLDAVGTPTDQWMITYPHGGWNEDVVAAAKDRHCTVGFTVAVDIADLNRHDALLLPRLDTNHLPKRDTNKPDEWTRRVI